MPGAPLYEVGLWAAGALPILTIAALNAFLFLTGERGTLLVPIPQRLATLKADDRSCPTPLEDAAFAAEVEGCQFPNERFKHAEHIRLAWIYIRQYGYEMAEERIRQSIRRFALHAGAQTKYHETVTIAWMRLVGAALHLSARLETFSEFSRAHAWLLDKRSVFEFYSRDRLMSEGARAAWIDPDLKPLPNPSWQ